MANTSLITFLLDRSGSMGSIKEATIEAFNGYLDGLKGEKDADIHFNFLTFDTVSIDKICVDTPIADVAPLTSDTYRPRSGTPLIDAAMATIDAVDVLLAKRSDAPRIVVCIQTDGEENASLGHTWDQLKAKIKAKQEAGWEFNFMGAGIDAYVQASRMGVSTAHTMSYNSADLGETRAAFAASASNHADYSAGRAASTRYVVGQKAAAGEHKVHVGVTVDLTKATPPTPKHNPMSVTL